MAAQRLLWTQLGQHATQTLDSIMEAVRNESTTSSIFVSLKLFGCFEISQLMNEAAMVLDEIERNNEG